MGRLLSEQGGGPSNDIANETGIRRDPVGHRTS
jgi:hypothetical protein